MSISATRLAGPSATYARVPSRVSTRPTAWMFSRAMPGTAKATLPVILRAATSMTETVPRSSDDTQIDLPSDVNCALRGRASTSTLASMR